MDKMMVLNAFNQVNMQFVDYCVDLLPDNIELATMKNALDTLISTTPELNLITFRECTVKKYRDKIEGGDIRFFVERNYDVDCANIGISKLIFEKMDSLRMPVGKMDKVHQNALLDFLKKMIKLCDIYN